MLLINKSILTYSILLLDVPVVIAFGVSSLNRVVPTLQPSRVHHFSVSLSRRAKSSDDDMPKGMKDAFRQLDELKAVGDDAFSVPEVPKIEKNEGFSKAMEEIDLSDIDVASPATVESEAELYKDMVSELSDSTELDLIANVKSDMGSKIPMEIPQFDRTQRDTEKFMEKALDEALNEAGKEGNIEVDKESLLDNKEIMKEIEKIFDKANEELLDELEVIRKEQVELAKATAEKSAQETRKRSKEEDERLALAQANMKKMLVKFNEEAKNVEAAIGELKQAQLDAEGGVDSQLSSLKSGGIVKQAAFVGTLLFSLRSAVEGVAYMSGDPSHLLPAIIQAVIAVVCLVAFIFL